ncbi:translation initiation factor IF-2-like [Helianthus annuus]|uniref:translation initiation factor IF-2-like n=1 Tax=Helianthus annuus TaxID=4232 RepID=UPI0016533EDB|nr:translation initiation factor IF-2-like [Helianthus annuus]
MANAIMEDYQALGRKEEEAARLQAEAEKLAKAAREGVEQLEKDKAAFEKHNQTEEWAATVELKQELANVKAANAALVKEKAAAEAAVGKAREAEARAAKAFEEAKEAEVQNREAMLAEVTARATEAERRASEAAEARDSLTSSFNQLEMTVNGCGVTVLRIVPEMLALKLVTTDASVIETFWPKANTPMNTEALLNAASASFYDTSISALEKLDECLDAEDYVDRLRMLYADAEESEEEGAAGDGKDGAGTSELYPL